MRDVQWRWQWLLPCVAMAVARSAGAETTGWLELGVGAVINGNGQFGEHRRFYQSDRFSPLGSLGLDWRDSADRFSSAGLAATADVDHLGLSAAHQRQGDYRIGFDYHQFEFVSKGEVSTAFASRDPVHSLPPGFPGVGSAQRFQAHAGVKREGFALDLMRNLGPWQVRAELGREFKDGDRLTGASERFGDATLLLAGVDQRHDTLKVGIEYRGQGWLVNGEYYFSRFTNNARAQTFVNPINLSAPPRTLDTGPDNEFTRLSMDGYYRLAPGAQWSFYLAHGDARQDDTFVEPLLVAGLAPTPSLDARRVDTDLRLGFRARPTTRFGYRLNWDYRDRDNRTDSIPLSPTTYSRLYDSTRERWSARADYRLPARMRLRGGWEHTRTQRTTRARERFHDEVDATRWWLKLRLPSIGTLSWSVRVETTDRDSDLSVERVAELDPAAPGAALPDYLLPGRAWEYRLQGDMPLTERVMLGASWRHAREDFDNDFYGLRGRDSDEFSLNLSWQLQDDLSLGVFALYQTFSLEQDGFEFHPGFAPTHANARWRQSIDDTSRSAGFNLRWQPHAAVTATLDLSYSNNDSSYRSRWLEDTDLGDTAGATDSLPGWGMDIQRVEGTIEWQRSARFRYRLRYLYERFRSDDWAWEGDQFNALGFDWRSPRYDGHAVLLSVQYRLAARP